MTKNKVLVSFLMVFMLIAALFMPLGATAEANAEDSFSVTATFSYTNLRSEQVNYSRKVDTMYYFDGAIGDFYSLDPNGCVPIAGSIAIDYYNRAYPQLIPGRQSTKYVNGVLQPYSQTAEIKTLITTLTTLMGGTTNGVTMANMKSGMTSYVNGKGLKTSYNSVMTTNYLQVLFLTISLGTSFDYSKYVSEINAGHPVILGLSSYHLADIGTAGNMDVLSYVYPKSSANHAMVGFGYRTIQYFRTESISVWSPTLTNPFRTITLSCEVLFRTETFLMASTGQGELTYLNINHSFNVLEAFGMTVTK